MFDIKYYDKAYLALFLFTIILTYLITYHFFEKIFAIFIHHFLNNRLRNVIILKFGRINFSLIFFCLKINNLKKYRLIEEM